MLRNSVKRIVWLSFVLWISMIPVFAAKIIVQPVSQQFYYGCPFDVDIMIDAQWEDNIGASIYLNLQTGLTLQWFAFGDQFNLNFPIKNAWNLLKAYAFKFPWAFTGLVKFATLRLVQNENIEKNSLLFHFNRVGDTTDWVDVYYMWGMDALKSIENKEFAFLQWNCPSSTNLSGDQMNSLFDQQGHLMWLYKTIDDYVNQKNKFNLMSWLGSNVYYVISVLMLLLLLTITVILYKKWKLHKILKNNSIKNAN